MTILTQGSCLRGSKPGGARFAAADWGEGRQCGNCGAKMSRYTPPPDCWMCREADPETRKARNGAWLASGGSVPPTIEPAKRRETPGARRKRIRYEVLEVLLDQTGPRGTTFISGALCISKNASWKRLLTLNKYGMVTKHIEERVREFMNCGHRAHWGLTPRGHAVGLLLRHGPLTSFELNSFMLLEIDELKKVISGLEKEGIIYLTTDETPLMGLTGIRSRHDD